MVSVGTSNFTGSNIQIERLQPRLLWHLPELLFEVASLPYLTKHARSPLPQQKLTALSKVRHMTSGEYLPSLP